MSRIGWAGYASPYIDLEVYREEFIGNKNFYLNKMQEIIGTKNEFIYYTLPKAIEYQQNLWERNQHRRELTDTHYQKIRII